MDDFERIYAEYYDQVYGYCLKLTHDIHYYHASLFFQVPLV